MDRNYDVVQKSLAGVIENADKLEKTQDVLLKRMQEFEASHAAALGAHTKAAEEVNKKIQVLQRAKKEAGSLDACTDDGKGKWKCISIAESAWEF